MVMKKNDKKFTWCVRYYNLATETADYRFYYDLTVSEIERLASDFTASHSGYIVRVFKYYKMF